jgi:CRP-like cAMP-binding protein
MSPIKTSPSYKNRILASLSPAETARLAPNLVPVRLEVNTTLVGAGEKVSDSYFIEDGMASIVIPFSDGSSVEVGVVGRDGTSALPILMGTETVTTRTFMQIAGQGYRIKAARFRDEYSRGDKLHTMSQNYLQSHLAQASQNAACNRFHNAAERLAKWLLACSDRTGSRHLPLTHEFLSQMLGTRRSTVTLAAGILQRAGFIEYSRGHVNILDSKGLEAAACECYRTVRNESQRLGVI